MRSRTYISSKSGGGIEMAAEADLTREQNQTAESVFNVPGTFMQIPKLMRYQFSVYLQSRRFYAMITIIVVTGALLSVVVADFRPSFINNNLAFYGSLFAGPIPVVIVLAAVFFGGDAIAGEFQNKTGYFLMSVPIRRATIYVAKYIAAFLASLAIMALYVVILLVNGVYYFGSNAFPWQLGLSFVLSIVYLAAVLGTTFLFSSLFKTSAYGFVMTVVLFLFGFSLLEELMALVVKIEPWMVISYASGVMGDVFSANIHWGFTGIATTLSTRGPGGVVFRSTTYTPGVGEGMLIMFAYFIITAIVGLFRFERQEFN